MTILICGASGILGKELANLFDKLNVLYIGTYNNNKIKNGIKIDFFNLNEIKEIMINNGIKICINCIVERQLEICEGDWNKIKKTNIDITNNLSKISKILNIHFIHISTDYVFDGKNAPYFPRDQTNPLQNYGISKLISEHKVLANCVNYTIIRVPVLYTNDMKSLEDSAVTLIGKKILNRTELYKEDNFSIRRPTYIPDFCLFIYDFIKVPKIGTFHFCNPHDKVTKFEIASKIAYFLNKKLNITPINEEPQDGAERPKDTFLKDDKYNIFDYKFTELSKGLEFCFSKLYHPKLEINNNTNVNNVFFLIDLDGTLIDTEKLHFNAYKDALKTVENFNLTYEEYNYISCNEGIEKHLIKTFGMENKCKIKILKNQILQSSENIEIIKNADIFIDWLDKYNINHVVVTNTSLENVNFFKSKVPILNKIKNWITRHDYTNAKPDSECYELAKKMYYKNEKYIIGIENTLVGYNSIKNITECVYIITNKNEHDYDEIKNKDVYIINDFLDIISIN
jgi:dTDP-4-dehydrorhamnose reductase/beta-phosphoglucomutase-like phosphatase (HAD superfamily)